MPFPRPDNILLVVAESWIFIDRTVSQKSVIGRETVGYFLSSLTDCILERHPSNRTPRQLDIRSIISAHEQFTTSAYIEEEVQIEWYSSVS